MPPHWLVDGGREIECGIAPLHARAEENTSAYVALNECRDFGIRAVKPRPRPHACEEARAERLPLQIVFKEGAGTDATNAMTRCCYGDAGATCNQGDHHDVSSGELKSRRSDRLDLGPAAHCMQDENGPNQD